MSTRLMVARFSRPSMMAQRESLLLTRAKKKAAGKKRGKVKIEAPEGFDIDMMAKDWAAWEHGAKIDVTLPFKEGEEPEWVLEMLKNQDQISRIGGDLSQLDLEKHGMRYTLRKLRESKIKLDNDLRAERKWDLVPSLGGTRTKKRKSLTSRGNLT